MLKQEQERGSETQDVILRSGQGFLPECRKTVSHAPLWGMVRAAMRCEAVWEDGWCKRVVHKEMCWSLLDAYLGAMASNLNPTLQSPVSFS